MKNSTRRLGSFLAALLALFTAVAAAGLPVRAGDVPTVELTPNKALAGSKGISITGYAFGKTGKVVVSWAGKFLVSTTLEDGEFSTTFEVPDTSPGKYLVSACGYQLEECDQGEASAIFTVLGQATPTPTKPSTEPPTKPPTKPPSQPPTKAPTDSIPTIAPPNPDPPGTPRPTPTSQVSQPPIIVPPVDELPVVPWLVNQGGPCTDVPFAGPTRVVDFETPLPASLGWQTVGERGGPPMGTRSGSTGFGSLYDDFGSADRPIVIDFGIRGEAELALFVGREQPIAGSGDILVVLTGIGDDGSGQLVELARATRTLEEAAIPTTRCLRLVAPPGRFFRTITLEYLDAAGASSIERRWMDDLVLPGATPTFRGTVVPEPQITILAPADGSTLQQIETERVYFSAMVRWWDPEAPRANLRVNRSGPLGGYEPVTFRRAPGGDPYLYLAEGSVRDGLRNDQVNHIEMIMFGPQNRDYRAETNFTLAVPIAGNLRVVGIEVNQATQVPGNLVPLIADKRTVVRVFVEGTPDERGPWGQITGELATTTADGTRRTHQPLRWTTPRRGPISRYGTDSQLVFLLDRVETGTGRLRLEVELRPFAPRVQTNTADDRSSTEVRFIEPLRYTAYGVVFSFPDGLTNDWFKFLKVASYIENVFPVSSAQFVQVPGIGTTVQPVQDINGLRDRTGSLLGRLPPEVSIMGMWPGEEAIPSLCRPVTGCELGLAFNRRTDAVGHSIIGPQVAAQELAHAEGLMWHAETGAHSAPPPFGYWNPFWPWPHSDIGHPGMDTRNPAQPMLISPRYYPIGTHFHDFMSYAGGNIWVSPYTYCVLLETFTQEVDRCPAGARDAPAQEFVGGAPRTTGVADPTIATGAKWTPARAYEDLDAEVEYLLVRGEIAWDAKSATLSPIESIHRALELPFDGAGDAFTLQVRGADGSPLMSMAFTPTVTHGAGAPVPFSFRVRRPDGAASVVVLRGDEVLGRRDASQNPPEIVIQASPAATIDSAQPLGWTATDADGDALTYAVEVSTDGQKSWFPLAVGLDQPQVTVDPATIPGSPEVWLRVQASDGFHSAAAVAGPFTVAAHAPSVELVSPIQMAPYAEGAPVLLESHPSDVEDGMLDDASVVWTSDRDGPLGTGRWLVIQSLSTGEHQITVRVTDSDGATAETTVRIDIDPADQQDPADPVQPDGSSAPVPPAPAPPAAAPPPAPPAGPPAADGSAPVLMLAVALVAVFAAAAAVGLAWYRSRRRTPRTG